MVAHELETDDYKKARKFYQYHDSTWKCYPQVYVDGKPLTKAKADRLFYAGQFREIFYQDATLAKIQAAQRKKKKP